MKDEAAVGTGTNEWGGGDRSGIEFFQALTPGQTIEINGLPVTVTGVERDAEMGIVGFSFEGPLFEDDGAESDDE